MDMEIQVHMDMFFHISKQYSSLEGNEPLQEADQVFLKSTNRQECYEKRFIWSDQC